MDFWRLGDGVVKGVSNPFCILPRIAVEDFLAEAVGRPDAVFVKAVALPCAAVVAVGGLGGCVELRDAGLGGDGGGGEERVLVVQAVDDFFLGDVCGGIDRDEVVFVFGYVLELVHPVMGGVLSATRDVVVP